VQPSKKLTSICSNATSLTEQDIFNILDKLKSTATGLDALPAWFLRISAPSISSSIAAIFNLSLTTSFVPAQWTVAKIVPIPKIPHPVLLSDYRPISITPVLSRVLERLVVSNYLYPSFTHPPPTLTFSDQFAFRPTGSTTSALITILQTVTNLLSSNPFVRMIAIDFSKAFDSVRHAELGNKLAMLDIPDNIHNWLISFLENRAHCTDFQGLRSTTAKISASIVQGSAVGPAAYAVVASDLSVSIQGNFLVKFADDTYLIVPAKNSSTCSSEIANIESWAAANNLKFNRSKTFEIIFRKPRTHLSPGEIPPVIPGVERVSSLKCLGITITPTLSFTEHIRQTLITCQQSFYALKILRSHGLGNDALSVVFNACTLSKLTYCSPAWWGFANSNDRDMLEAFLKRARKFNYASSSTPTVSEICDRADHRLFERVISNKNHVLYPLLPPKVRTSMTLRKRRHEHALPLKKSKLDESNFLCRMLYFGAY